MDLRGVEIRTERLLLTPLSHDYAESIFHEFSPEVTAFMFPAPAKDISETRAFIDRALENLRNGSHLTMAVLDGETGEFLGCTGLHELGAASPELGVWLKTSAHGNHYGYEAVRALVVWAAEYLSCSTLKYPVDERNIPSRRIPERLGGSIVGRVTETSMSGRELQLLEYAIPLAR